MSKWRVIKRNLRGEKEELILDATNRKELFEKLNILKITAICVSEVVEKKKSCSYTATIKKILFFTSFLLVLSLISVVIFYRNKCCTNKDIVKSTNHKTIFKDKISIAKKSNKFATNDPTTIPPTVLKRYENGVEVLSSIVITNTNGAIIEKLNLADGTKKKIVSPPPPIFNNPSDQLIAMAISIKPGQSMPPFPNMTGIDEEFKKSLLQPIIINDDDPPKLKELKSLVIETRVYLEEEVKKGGSVVQALLAHQAELNRISDHRLMAIQEIGLIKEKDGLQSAIDFARKVNEAFKARGIPEVHVPGEKIERHN